MDTLIPVHITPNDDRQAVVSRRNDFVTLFFEENAYILRGDAPVCQMLKENPAALTLCHIKNMEVVSNFRYQTIATLCELSFVAHDDAQTHKAYFGMITETQFRQGLTFTAATMPLPGTLFYQPPPRPSKPRQIKNAEARRAAMIDKQKAKAALNEAQKEQRAVEREEMLAAAAYEKAKIRLEEAAKRLADAKIAVKAWTVCP